MNNNKDYQNAILTELCHNQIPLTVFLMNGFQMRGTLIAFDNFVLIVEVDGRQQMIYKHAISTLIPHSAFEATTN